MIPQVTPVLAVRGGTYFFPLLRSLCNSTRPPPLALMIHTLSREASSIPHARVWGIYSHSHFRAGPPLL